MSTAYATCPHCGIAGEDRAGTLPPMAVFVGLDLAWTSHHETGLCVFAENGGEVRLAALECLVRTPAGFADLLAGYGPDIVAAIDAPLVITPARQAERLLARHFGRYRASAHQANEALLRKNGMMAGPELAGHAATHGFILDPLALAARCGGRFAFEVYPHACHVVWFRLAERIRYKQKPGVRVADRRAGLRELQCRLRGVLAAELPAAAHDLASILDPAAAAARGRSLKQLEDMLDAITCAVAAFRAWRDGLTGGDVLGTAADGYVAVPGLAADPRFATSVPGPTCP